MSHTNFVLLAQPRSGSNLMLRALAEHPQIRMIGEVLNGNPAVRADAWQLVNPDDWTFPRGDGYLTGQDGGEFLAKRIFSDGPIENLRAFGFKLFYDGANFDDGSRRAWDYLVSHEIKVIHLTRQNLLDAYVSRQLAERTGRFQQPIEDPTPISTVSPFPLDRVECRRYFEQILARRAWVRQAFGGHDMIEVEYERDLCADFSGSTQRVHKFLGVVPWKLRPGMRRLRTLPASEQIANFQELRAEFAGSEYEVFFAEAELPPAGGQGNG